MKAKKIIRYRLSVSRTFPATHKRAGRETYFVNKIILATTPPGILSNFDMETEEPKLHTIRGNYQLWQKRFEKIEKGEAVLELYYWTGKPYNSKCETICQLSKEDGIGLQKLELDDYLYTALIDGKRTDFDNIPQNDGLSHRDFEEWFKRYDFSEPMAIIHFTKFRY